MTVISYLLSSYTFNNFKIIMQILPKIHCFPLSLGRYILVEIYYFALLPFEVITIVDFQLLSHSFIPEINSNSEHWLCFQMLNQYYFPGIYLIMVFSFFESIVCITYSVCNMSLAALRILLLYWLWTAWLWCVVLWFSLILLFYFCWSWICKHVSLNIFVMFLWIRIITLDVFFSRDSVYSRCVSVNLFVFFNLLKHVKYLLFRLHNFFLLDSLTLFLLSFPFCCWAKSVLFISDTAFFSFEIFIWSFFIYIFHQGIFTFRLVSMSNAVCLLYICFKIFDKSNVCFISHLAFLDYLFLWELLTLYWFCCI